MAFVCKMVIVAKAVELSFVLAGTWGMMSYCNQAGWYCSHQNAFTMIIGLFNIQL